MNLWGKATSLVRTAALLGACSLFLAACGQSGNNDQPPVGESPAACSVILPEKLGTVTLRKGPDDCPVHYVYPNADNSRRALAVEGDLTIEAGTVIEFATGTMLDVRRQGSLTALGNSAEPITFRGAVSTHGSWYGICFDSNRESSLDHVRVLYGGAIWSSGESPVCEGGISGSVRAGEPVHITNSLILGSRVSGVSTYNLTLGRFTNNVLADNYGYPVRVHASQAGSLDASSDYTGSSLDLPNGHDHVFLWGVLSDPLTSHHWSDLGTPWFVGDGGRIRFGQNVIVSDGAELTIEAGAHFEFGAGSSFNVWDGAEVTALGTAQNPVVFDGVLEEPGSWEGLSFSRAGASVFDYAVIRWAGDPDGLYVGPPAAVHVYLSSLSLTHTVIHGSGACAVSVANLNPGQAVDLMIDVQNHESGYPEVCGDLP